MKPGVLFALKCIMTTNPITLVLLAYFFSIPYTALMLEVAERPTLRIPNNTMVFNFPNSMWNIIITMSTGK